MDQAKDSEIRCVDFQSSVFHVLQQQRPQRKSPDRHGTSWKYEEMDLRWFQLAPVEQHGLALNVCLDSGLRCFPNLERHQMTTSDSPVWPRLRVCQEKILFFLCSTDEKIWIKPYRAWFKMMFLGIVVCSDNFVDHVLLKSEIKAVKFSTSVERIRCLQNASYSISGQIKVASTRLLFRSVNWSVRCIIAHYSYTNICWRYFCEHFTLFDQTWIYTWNFRLSKRCVFRILRVLISWLFNREPVLLHRELTDALEERCNLRANEGLHDCSGWCPHYPMVQCWKEPGDVALSSGPFEGEITTTQCVCTF